MRRRVSAGRWGLALGLGFLWAPILLLAVYAFSADRIPFQWGGFSLRWFEALAANERMLEAAWLSLRVAAGSATLAVAIYTMGLFDQRLWRKKYSGLGKPARSSNPAPLLRTGQLRASLMKSKAVQSNCAEI